jgi:hypothetical protein
VRKSNGYSLFQGFFNFAATFLVTVTLSLCFQNLLAQRRISRSLLDATSVSITIAPLI